MNYIIAIPPAKTGQPAYVTADVSGGVPIGLAEGTARASTAVPALAVACGFAGNSVSCAGRRLELRDRTASIQQL